MTRSPRFWLAVAVLFVLGNVAGGLYALRMNEGWHALTHFLLLVPGGFWMSWLMRKRRAIPSQRIEPDGDDDRLQRVEQAVEAVEVEAERVGALVELHVLRGRDPKSDLVRRIPD
ncbi:MAG: hypothetical protein ABIV11_08140 [Gemmatimonadaceae bacterium]